MAKLSNILTDGYEFAVRDHRGGMVSWYFTDDKEDAIGTWADINQTNEKPKFKKVSEDKMGDL